MDPAATLIFFAGVGGLSDAEPSSAAAEGEVYVATMRAFLRARSEETSRRACRLIAP